MLVVPDSGIKIMAKVLSGESPQTSFAYHLYTACSSGPSYSSAIGDFTEVTSAEFPGYAPKTAVNWKTHFVRHHVAITTADLLIWQPASNPPSPVVILGYFVTDAGGDLVWAEAFEWGPYTFTLLAQQLPIEPLLGLKSAC